MTLCVHIYGMRYLHVTRDLACLRRVVVIAGLRSHDPTQPSIHIRPLPNYIMAGFKRGGFRGGAGGAYKKSYAKKRAASDDEEGAPQASKKTKGDSGEEEESTPFVPELKTDDDGQKYIGVSMRRRGCERKTG
jgi:hypothetical protein